VFSPVFPSRQRTAGGYRGSQASISDIGGNVPDWDNTESRESDEDAAWRDLVARFEEPATTTGPVPWPERENVPGQRPPLPHGTDVAPTVHETDGARGIETAPGGPGTGTAQGPAGAGTDEAAAADDTRERGPGGGQEAGGDGNAGGTRGVEGVRGFDDEGVRGAFEADRLPGTREPDETRTARRGRRTAAHGVGARRVRARKAPPRPAQEDDEGHYVPPAPPPLPRPDPITKGAWAALFGGPAYLVVATAVGWPVPGIAAFFAVAAFVTGFAVLVLRMNDPGPGDPGDGDDGDDGAVV
jgi:hypothetical protein